MHQTEKSTVKRGAKRALYGEDEINSILDSAFICHVGFCVDGEVRVIPTAYVRIGQAIYLHGHLRNQMIRSLLDGQCACITVTQVDGLVLARSAFHHSVNYRSVVVLGKAEPVAEHEKIPVLDALINHLVPGRADELRPYTAQELNATLAIKFSIEEASAKVRSGPPVDGEKDYELDTWAGVLNLNTVIDGVNNCPHLKQGIELPEHVKCLIGNKGGNKKAPVG